MPDPKPLPGRLQRLAAPTPAVAVEDGLDQVAARVAAGRGLAPTEAAPAPPPPAPAQTIAADPPPVARPASAGVSQRLSPTNTFRMTEQLKRRWTRYKRHIEDTEDTTPALQHKVVELLEQFLDQVEQEQNWPAIK